MKKLTLVLLIFFLIRASVKSQGFDERGGEIRPRTKSGNVRFFKEYTVQDADINELYSNLEQISANFKQQVLEKPKLIIIFAVISFLLGISFLVFLIKK